jgi:uncharacterized protein YndB with AHSA1/START domain
MNQADGSLVVSGEIAVIAFERRLNHAIDTVWAAITDPGQLAAWLGPGELEPREGGRILIRTGPAGQPEQQRSISGRILIWKPPHVLEHEWLQPGLEVSVVRYELTADGEATVLRFTHRRSLAPAATGGRAGWHAFLDRLAAHLDGAPVPDWAERRRRVQESYGEAPLGGAEAR